jgi:phosphate transport system substrate-binding protein
VGEGTVVEWPLGAGGQGNEGVAAFVNQTKDAVGYVGYIHALQYRMAYGAVQNKANVFIKPSAEAFQAAAASADWPAAKDFNLVMTDAPGEGSYPIAATVFAIMYKQPKNPQQAAVAMDFFKWAFTNGQVQAEALDYVPLPASLVQQIESYWKTQFAWTND